MVGRNKLNEYSGNPVSYMLVSREVPGLLPKPNSLVWNRAGFARHAIHVTRHSDDELYPAGRHVPQHSGLPAQGLPSWIEANPDASIDNEDIVLWHTFGITHFPRTEDFPLMPAEPLSIMLRASTFFEKNPALWVPPTSHDRDTSSKDLNKCCEGSNRSAEVRSECIRRKMGVAHTPASLRGTADGRRTRNSHCRSQPSHRTPASWLGRRVRACT